MGGIASPDFSTIAAVNPILAEIDAAHARLSPDAQAQAMEQDLQKIKASGLAVPPGYHAHLGLLYGQQGDLDKFAQQVEQEKSKFPESQTFMDFLMRKFKK